MKVSLVKEMRAVDRRAGEEYGLPEVVLMENVQIERLGPPVHVGHAAFGRTAVHDRTFAFTIFLQVTHCQSPQGLKKHMFHQ